MIRPATTVQLVAKSELILLSIELDIKFRIPYVADSIVYKDKNDRKKGYTDNLGWITKQEIMELCDEVGFLHVSCYGSFMREPFDATSSELVFEISK